MSCFRAINQNAEALTYLELILSLFLRDLLCCIRRIRLFTAFSVKLQRYVHLVKLSITYVLWVLKGSFPFWAPMVNLTACASIKPIILRHVTNVQKCSLKGSKRDLRVFLQPGKLVVPETTSDLTASHAASKVFVLILLCISSPRVSLHVVKQCDQTLDYCSLTQQRTHKAVVRT